MPISCSPPNGAVEVLELVAARFGDAWQVGLVNLWICKNIGECLCRHDLKSLYRRFANPLTLITRIGKRVWNILLGQQSIMTAMLPSISTFGKHGEGPGWLIMHVHSFSMWSCFLIRLSQSSDVNTLCVNIYICKEVFHAYPNSRIVISGRREV